MTLPTSFLNELLARRQAEAESLHDGLARRCHSPIENLFLTAFYFTSQELGGFLFDEPPLDGPLEHAFFFVKPQEPIDEYRADFVIGLYQYPARTRIVVECDGHDFHERTKEQAAHDRKRDRAFQAKGFVVFRFTGSELYRNAFKCADEVCSHLILIHSGDRR